MEQSESIIVEISTISPSFSMATTSFAREFEMVLAKSFPEIGFSSSLIFPSGKVTEIIFLILILYRYCNE